MNANASTAVPQGDEAWSIRGLLARHKLAAAGAAAVIAVMVAMVLVELFGSRAAAVSDATTCSQWGSANQAQQAAYARRYVREHGPIQNAGTSPATVINAINAGCARAYGDDVSDTVTLVQAISGKF